MNKLLSALVAVLATAAPTIAAPWSYPGEGLRWHWDVSPAKDNLAWLTVHERNARWVDGNRLRVEFTIRHNGRYGNSDRSYNPEVLYDEYSRCDNGAVCDPPLYPVVSYMNPIDYHLLSSGKWYTHSMTIDCKNSPVIRWKTESRNQLLSAKSVCAHFQKLK